MYPLFYLYRACLFLAHVYYRTKARRWERECSARAADVESAKAGLITKDMESYCLAMKDMADAGQKRKDAEDRWGRWQSKAEKTAARRQALAAWGSRHAGYAMGLADLGKAWACCTFWPDIVSFAVSSGCFVVDMVRSLLVG